MDRERYKYLLKAISGLNKGNKLADFKYDRVHNFNPEELYSNISLKFGDSLLHDIRSNSHKN